MILHFRDGNLENPTVWKRGTADLNGKYEVDPKKLSRRSNQQNRYYHGVVVQMVWQRFRDWGNEWSKGEVHEFLKKQFNLAEFPNPNTGEVIEMPISTTRLTKSRFAEYIEEIQRWAAKELDIYIPDPNEQTEIFGQGENNRASD